MRLSIVIQIVDIRRRARRAENLMQNPLRVEPHDRISVNGIRNV
jgi:hypothetical protein